MISHKNKYVFTHVPRTGGTSIEYALRTNSDPEDLTNKNPDDINTYLCTQHIHIHKVNKIATILNIDISDYFKFTFIRNPWDRLLSFYHYNHLSNEVPVKQIKELNFVDYCLRVDGNPKLASRTGLLAPSLYCKPPGHETMDVMVDYVGKYETLQHDFDRICDMIGISRVELTRQRSTSDQASCPWHVERKIQVRRPTKPTKDYYTKELIEFLQPYFAVEINKYNYPDEPK